MLDEHNYQLTGLVSSYLPPRIHLLSVQLHYSPRFDRLHLRSIVSQPVDHISLFYVSLQYVAAWCPTSVSSSYLFWGSVRASHLRKIRGGSHTKTPWQISGSELNLYVPVTTQSKKQSPRGLPKQKQTWRLRALTYTLSEYREAVP